MTENIRRHYDTHPYPRIHLLASVRPCDTYALNLTSLWARFNGELLPPESQRMLLAGCGTFSPYPFSIANPCADIVALDLSVASLARARQHLRLHGCRNVTTLAGDILCPETAEGPFHFIDAYGVIHHVEYPLAALRSLSHRLTDGGILRLMVYSTGARRGIESIRRALRFLGIQDPETAHRLLARAPAGSPVRDAFDALPEAASLSGCADAFLHPCVKTYRIDELLEVTEQAGLVPLLFTHPGAVQDIDKEVARLREEEKSGEIYYNYSLYLGKRPRGGAVVQKGAQLMLNPVLQRQIGMFSFLPLKVDGRLGFANPVLDSAAKRFLRRFRKPVPVESLSGAEIERARPFLAALFLTVMR